MGLIDTRADNDMMVPAPRLDPWGGRQTTRYASPDALRTPVEVTLDETGAVMKRRLTCGAPLSMALPHRVFAGVAARALVDEDGAECVTLELRHADADLCVPLATWASFEDAAADWHSWARRTGLPMLLIAADGSVETVKPNGAATSRKPAARRARVTSVSRRPRFLRRRKTGMVGPVVRITADEIIARN